MEIITNIPSTIIERDQKVISKKPPLPPKKNVSSGKTVKIHNNHIQWKSDEDSAQQIAKLLAQNEKLNLEISEHRMQLQRERNGVRELR